MVRPDWYVLLLILRRVLLLRNRLRTVYEGRMRLAAEIPALAGLAMVCASCPARADFVVIGTPVSAYTSGTTLLPFTDPDNTTITSLSDGTETLTYSSPITEYTVPATWTLWNTPPEVETSTPRVGDTCDSNGNCSSTLTIGLSLPAYTFGFELEPDLYEIDPVTARFYDGASLVGTISQSVNGEGGALLFAATTTTSPFTSVVITDAYTADDFAIAQQRYGGPVSITPEPASFGLMLAAVFGLVVVTRLRRPVSN